MPHPDFLPRLELIPVRRIRFHERPEHRRTKKLVGRLSREGMLRNPPIVAEIGEEDYLLLDGANRVSAFAELRYREVPAQIVDYADPEILLTGWHHLLLEPEKLELERRYREIEALEVREIRGPGESTGHLGKAGEAVERALAFRQVYAVWMDRAGRTWGLYPAGPAPSVVERMQMLTRIIACYENRSALERVKLAAYDDLPTVTAGREHELCLFPTLTKEELVALVRIGELIPTGITRHIIPGRVLGLNLDLAFLREAPAGGSDPAASSERRAHLREHVESLALAGRVRYYEEPVFILNE